MLDVLRDENLQQHASEVGSYIKEALWSLAERRPLVGDVRGSGLFVGIDFVRDRQTREPATAETSEICSRMKDEHQVLMSIDGPYDNVLVIKPPLCFSRDDVDTMISALDHVLGNLRTAESTISQSRTPT